MDKICVWQSMWWVLLFIFRGKLEFFVLQRRRSYVIRQKKTYRFCCQIRFPLLLDFSSWCKLKILVNLMDVLGLSNSWILIQWRNLLYNNKQIHCSNYGYFYWLFLRLHFDDDNLVGGLVHVHAAGITNPFKVQRADLWRFEYWRIGSLTCRNQDQLNWLPTSSTRFWNGYCVNWPLVRTYHTCLPQPLLLGGSATDHSIHLFSIHSGASIGIHRNEALPRCHWLHSL